jgi:hypothetical protein
VAITLISLLISGYYYFRTQPELSRGRRWMLFLLRSVSLFILLLLLVSPILYYIKNITQKQQVILLEDVSASMDLASLDLPKSEFLKPYGKELAAKFSAAGYELHEYEFAAGLETETSNTLLSPALTELAKMHDFSRVKGILLVSDGWLKDESLSQVRQLGCPFHVLADTLRPQRSDLAVKKTITNRQAYRNEPTIIRAEIASENYNGPATVKLLLGGAVVATQNVRIKDGATSSVDFTHRFAQTGFYPYSVEVSAPGINERSQNNNTHPGAIEVLSDKQSIVVLSDTPAWDNKFSVDTIAGNPRWEVSHFRVRGESIMSGEDAVASLPEQNLAAILLINNGSLQLAGKTLDYVIRNHNKGVGILYQGLPVAELGSILPLQRSNVTSSYQGFLNLSPAAASYPMLSFAASDLQEIPPLDYYYVTATKTAEVLATIDNPQNSPAIAITGQEAGKVLSMAFLNLWKWQLQSESGGYKELLANCVTWLANTAESGYNAIYNTSYFRGEEINLRLRAQDDIRALRLDLNPELKVMDSEGKEVFRDFMSQSEGEYSATLSLDDAGQYSFEISDKVSGEKSSGRFNVADISGEDRDLDYNLPLLSWLASDTGGKLIYPSTLQDFSPPPAQGKDLQQRLDIPIYRKWWVLALFILAFCLELFFRRRWGLL